MTAVAELLEPPELYDWFVAQREAIGLHHRAARTARRAGTLLRTLRDGKLVGLLCDRDIAGNGVEVEFFGETTTLPAGPGRAGPAHRRAHPAHRRVRRARARAHGGDPAAGAGRAHRPAARRRGPGHPGRRPRRSRA